MPLKMHGGRGMNIAKNLWWFFSVGWRLELTVGEAITELSLLIFVGNDGAPKY